jgi:hypothetical protein
VPKAAQTISLSTRSICSPRPVGLALRSHHVRRLTPTSQWMDHANGCDAQPPAEGDFLELPVGGIVRGEYAHNKVSSVSVH